MMPPGSRVSLAVGFCVTDDGFWSRGLDLLASGSAHAFAGQFDPMGVVNDIISLSWATSIGISKVHADGPPATEASVFRQVGLAGRRRESFAVLGSKRT